MCRFKSLPLLNLSFDSAIGNSLSRKRTDKQKKEYEKFRLHCIKIPKKSSTQVQSDLSNLANTVNSIEGSLGTAIDSALADGLASINEVIAQLQSQVDNIATGEDVEGINEALEGVEEDIQELLESNNEFTGDLIINSEATLEFAESLNDRVKIVNGNVVVEAPSDLDGPRLQAVVNKIRVITKDLTIRAANSSALMCPWIVYRV